VFKLTTNNDHKDHPDSPQHHFKRVIASLMSTSDEEDYKATMEFAITLGANKQSDVKTLLKYKDVIDLFTQLYQFNVFKQHDFKPKQLLKCKKTIWGVS
jgi:hypothetical protein